MEFKGTKGSWKLAVNEYGYFTSVRNEDDTRKICVSRVNDMEHSNANLTLIAAAPDLLAALQNLIETCEKYLPNDFDLTEAKQAVKKALTIK